MMTSVTQSNRVKIGIRPTIDGRRMGVRESLEEQTMQMAKSVAELLQNHIRHTDGSFVECVIADTCIGGVAEAAACAEKFKLNNVGLQLLLLLVGAMVLKLLIWIRICQKPFGVSTARTSGSSLSCRRPCRPLSIRLTGIFHLWT